MADINAGSEIDNVEQKLTNCSEADVFAEVEMSLNIKIPETLKNLLIVNGFDNEIVISNINDSDIRDIVLFTRNDLHKIIDKEDLPKYYGLYWKNPSLFDIVAGHKRIISLLSEYYKKKLTKKLTKKTNKSQILAQLNSNSNQASTSKSTILEEENTRVRKAIVSWTQGKVNKNGWEALRELFDNIIVRTSLDADELHCAITCFCGATYNISKFAKGTGSRSKRWIYSNFQTHLLNKHIQNSSTTKSFVNQKNITDYVDIAEGINIAKVIDIAEGIDIVEVIDKAEIIINTENTSENAINIVDGTENIEKTSQYINNKEDKM
ncbi:uncharacterized protein [Temnothorax nylanderi]|uniref:uncharacterized protein n=1 Tax=Temnothorax nylanderi TaxID=102681 RepID=UPI003A8A1DEE